MASLGVCVSIRLAARRRLGGPSGVRYRNPTASTKSAARAEERAEQHRRDHERRQEETGHRKEVDEVKGYHRTGSEHEKLGQAALVGLLTARSGSAECRPGRDEQRHAADRYQWQPRAPDYSKVGPDIGKGEHQCGIVEGDRAPEVVAASPRRSERDLIVCKRRRRTRSERRDQGGEPAEYLGTRRCRRSEHEWHRRGH